MKIRNFRDLDIWRKGIEIVKDIYEITIEFPKSEFYGLVTQMRRSSVSISANIAEGFNRYHNKEYKQFLYISLGSCAELETHIEIAKELAYITDDKKNYLIEKLNHESRMISKLIGMIMKR